jgi:hypothetical protein
MMASRSLDRVAQARILRIELKPMALKVLKVLEIEAFSIANEALSAI